MKKQSGFTLVESLAVILILAVVGVVGYYVWHTHHKSSSPAYVSTTASKYASPAVQSNAEKVSSHIATPTKQSGPSAQSTPITSSSSATSNATNTESSQTSPTNTTFKSLYNNLSFKYSSTWSGKTWSNDTQSAAITVTSPNGSVLLSYGAPVVPPSTTACKPSSSNLYIYSVSKGPTLANTNALYVINYSDGDLKSVALTDWGGTQPVTGQTDKCSGYQPSFIDTKTGVYSWFKISDESDSYRGLSPTAFFSTTDAVDATTFINSATN